MKLNRKWLIIIVSILAVINLVLVFADRNLESDVKVYFLSQSSDKNADYFNTIIQDKDNANKISFGLINENMDLYSTFMSTYDIKTSSALIVLDSKGKLIKKISGPDQNRIKSEVEQYLN
ncbi:hypothetical protein D3C80_1902110 [compost metagenome]